MANVGDSYEQLMFVWSLIQRRVLFGVFTFGAVLWWQSLRPLGQCMFCSLRGLRRTYFYESQFSQICASCKIQVIMPLIRINQTSVQYRLLWHWYGSIRHLSNTGYYGTDKDQSDICPIQVIMALIRIRHLSNTGYYGTDKDQSDICPIQAIITLIWINQTSVQYRSLWHW
jgi:hypothetical protein